MDSISNATKPSVREMPASEAFTGLFLIFFWPLGVLMTLLFVRRWLKRPLFWACLLIWGSLTTLAFTGIRGFFANIAEQNRIKQEIIATERARDYFVSPSDNVIIKYDTNGHPYVETDCHLSSENSANDASNQPNASADTELTPSEIYARQVSNLVCRDFSLTGTYSAYDSVEPILHLYDGKTIASSFDDSTFTVTAQKPAFSNSDWEKDELSRPDYLSSTLHFKLNNTILDSETMLEYRLELRYLLSDNDFKLLESNQIAYQEYQTAEAERIAKEEAERLAKEEAEKKAETERLAAEQAAKDQNTTSKPQSAPTQPSPNQSNNNSQSTSKPSSSNNSTSKPTPSTSTPAKPQTTPSTNLPLKAICKDGTVSYQDNASLPNYRGMCSGHGGIKTKLGRVP